VSDILVSNFNVGWEINFTFEALIELRSCGCVNGILLQNNVNNCTFPVWEVTSSTYLGLDIQDSAQNNFHNGVMQGNNGQYGVRIARNCDNNNFYGCWLENNTYAVQAIYVGAAIGIGLASATFIGWRNSDVKGFYFEHCAGCIVIGTRDLFAPIVIRPEAFGVNLIGVNATVTDFGTGTVINNYRGGIDIGNAGLIFGTEALGRARLGFGVTTTPAAPTLGGTLYVKLVGASHQLFIRFPTGAEQLIAFQP
jgi:hypothetical protein